MTTELKELKRRAAETAVEAVESGMVVGLGTGSTAVFAIQAIGRLLAAGRLREVRGVPTSQESAQIARECGVPLTTLSESPVVDLTIDGADEVAPDLNLIKGLGGALLHEKIVAAISQRLIIIGDHTKRVTRLGEKAPVPVEVIPFARRPALDYLTSLGARAVLRSVQGDSERPFTTDEGNLIFDCYFGELADPDQLAQAIRRQPGIVEHGLFLDLATEAVIASPDGVEILARGSS